jgi:hypothetical protein
VTQRVIATLLGVTERTLISLEGCGLLAAKIDAADTFEDVPKEARALVRQSAIMAAAKDARLIRGGASTLCPGVGVVEFRCSPLLGRECRRRGNCRG